MFNEGMYNNTLQTLVHMQLYTILFQDWSFDIIIGWYVIIDVLSFEQVGMYIIPRRLSAVAAPFATAVPWPQH